MTSDTSREDRIRQRAYALWETEGRQDGHHERHWHPASAEIGEDHGNSMRSAESASDGADSNTVAQQLEPGRELADAVARTARPGASDPVYGPA